MITHRTRALTALSGKQADYIPHFEMVFHETERDFNNRVFIGTNFAPWDNSNTNIRDACRHNASLYIDIAKRFEHSIILVAPLEFPFEKNWKGALDIVKEIRDISGDEFCIMTHGDPTFKIPTDMMSFSIQMYEQPDKLHDIAKRKLDSISELYPECEKAGCDGIIMTSDYAMNTGPFLSPSAFAEFIVPYLEKAVTQAHTSRLKVIKHTDGNILPIIEQIIDTGIDALHSIDPMAGMNIKSIKEKYGHKICLCGNVHCAYMQTGTPDQIKESAEYCLNHGASGGGYIFSTSNCIFRGMPLESYDIIHDLWKTKREY